MLFDYEFFEAGKLTNYGIECWQLMKLDGRWRIFAVTWSQHEPS